MLSGYITMVLWYKYQDLAISLFPAEVGLFADLDRPLILELLCILASHCGGFTAKLHLIFITPLSSCALTSSWLWNEPVLRWLASCLPLCCFLLVRGSRYFIESWRWIHSGELQGIVQQARATAAAAKYSVHWGNTVTSCSNMFGTDLQAVIAQISYRVLMHFEAAMQLPHICL